MATRPPIWLAARGPVSSGAVRLSCACVPACMHARGKRDELLVCAQIVCMFGLAMEADDAGRLGTKQHDDCGEHLCGRSSPAEFLRVAFPTPSKDTTRPGYYRMLCKGSWESSCTAQPGPDISAMLVLIPPAEKGLSVWVAVVAGPSGRRARLLRPAFGSSLLAKSTA